MRFPRFARRCLVAATLVQLGTAHASDIDCDPSATAASSTPAHRLICESALFSMGHRRIEADQQRLLKAGAIGEADIAAFRRNRDRCDSAACLDAVFREWRAFAAGARGTR
ncbi:hypothetical protein CURE108131_03420 [Cupriavidus respiraculi]|uniref:Lysozyme inhibitor LprI N-terminal domain-containing protein n=1 Tax=Cupriavidus respiraculi TaxID=195930 RepID=A0ABM8WHS5_9BURK|nr:hypothetical protein [Cupriavidus respiraculi]CAG9166810.1 hypothetical protein LMG21510_00556 [Cupriavidus respiraculi]